MGMGQDLYPAILGYLGTRVLTHNQMVSLGTIIPQLAEPIWQGKTRPSWCPGSTSNCCTDPSASYAVESLRSSAMLPPPRRIPSDGSAAERAARATIQFRIDAPEHSRGETLGWLFWVRILEVWSFNRFLHFWDLGFWMALILDGGIWVIIC